MKNFVLLALTVLLVQCACVRADGMTNLEVASIARAAIRQELNEGRETFDVHFFPSSLIDIDESRSKHVSRLDYVDPVTGQDIKVEQYTVAFTTEVFPLYNPNDPTSGQADHVAVYERRGPENASPGLRLVSFTGKRSGLLRPSYGRQFSIPLRPETRQLVEELVAVENQRIPVNAELSLKEVFSMGNVREITSSGLETVLQIAASTTISGTGTAYWKWVARYTGGFSTQTGKPIMSLKEVVSRSSYVLGADPLNALPMGSSDSPVIDVAHSAYPSLLKLVREGVAKSDLTDTRELQSTVVNVIEAKQQQILDYTIGFDFDIMATHYWARCTVELLPGSYSPFYLSLVYREPLNAPPRLSVVDQKMEDPPSKYGSSFIGDRPGFPIRDMAEAAAALFNAKPSEQRGGVTIQSVNSGEYGAILKLGYFAVAAKCTTNVADDVHFKFVLTTEYDIDRNTGRTGSLTATGILSQSASAGDASEVGVPTIIWDVVEHLLN